MNCTVGLWLTLCNTRFAWAVRVAYFYWGQRRSEYGVSQCGNPRFLWLSTTTTRETSPCPTTERSPSSPHASPTVEKQALRWAEACCATFDLLLKARHPVIWGLGRTLCHRYSPEIQAALAEQHILLIFAERNTCRTNWQTVQTRNFQIASMSNESVYAMNIEGRSSSLEVLYDLEKGKKPVLHMI